MNVNICNFPIYGPIFMKFSQKCILGIFSPFWEDFAQFSIGKAPILGPEFGIGKSMVCRGLQQMTNK